MQHPVVHLNGTSRKELMQQYQRAIESVSVAITALCAAMPHGRDYYVDGDDAYPRARKEHESRIEALRKVHDELMELYLALHESRIEALRKVHDELMELYLALDE